MGDTASETLPALGICLEEYEYPYPVRFLPLTCDLQPVSMGYGDIAPAGKPNRKTVVLFHGKAFGGYYFRNVIEALTGAGYRVIAPDQIGWGKSSKPDINYSFQLLAANTAALLDHLGVGNVAVLGHSTGGMTATRFTLLYPDRVTHLALEEYATPAEAARLGDFAALSAAAAQDIPRATRVVIPDCGHVPHLEQPAAFLGQLLPFLAT
jgi:pimeloyl-ACP methyl ester carboxylesterase